MTETWDTPRARSVVREDAASRQTTVEEGTQFKGVMTSTCPVVVKGKVEGEIHGPSLEVSQAGMVAGTVKVDELRSQGVLSGEFDADTVELSGQVRDKTVIRARSMEVRLAPEQGRMEVVFGEVGLDVGDAPSKKDAVDDAAEAQKGNGKANGAFALLADDSDDDAPSDDSDDSRSKKSKKAKANGVSASP